ncbi:hypothetical protein MYRA21_3102 [Myroides sp. A21]|nr:hypothetical protein MYRA21_3102 [Myroides sp. A21]
MGVEGSSCFKEKASVDLTCLLFGRCGYPILFSSCSQKVASRVSLGNTTQTRLRADRNKDELPHGSKREAVL